MKNFLKLFGIIALAAVIGFSIAACDTGGGSGDGGGGGGGEAKYEVSWKNDKAELTFVMGGIEISETADIASKIKVADIGLSPADVITLQENPTTTSGYITFKATINKSGEVTVTLKPAVGYTFILRSGSDNKITVTK
jgi:hypothetical protein